MTDTPSSYHAAAVLTSGGMWQARVDELPEVRIAPHRSLSQLQRRVRKAIAEHQGLGTDAEALVLVMVASTGDPAFDQHIEEARTLRTRADELAAQARKAAAPLAARLVKAGVSTRDAGALLGVSAALVSSMTSTT
ncbi:hypothetical protein QMK19_35275 [Streptomyces sp. H10-C2]|uniref:hypothetical protein n=1 Tax=unclassified Streptomyces TaxID=2593676 RepID=UPI0024BAB6AF|nr:MULTISPECIES: hypothetical protein [unclassified Streptomyces]MDJ0345897.1 hypothetical protein [Streptomyces sp. PH10-H1]MDJ0374746.1 hypothetical protein [Streptomyces sp. H10-C2]